MTKAPLGEHKHGKQKRAQSKDFGEISSTQSKLDVGKEKYWRIFHNWDNPEKCARRNKVPPCWVCEQLLLGNAVYRDMGDGTTELHQENN